MQALRTADDLSVEEQQAESFKDRMMRVATKDLLAAAPAPDSEVVIRLREAASVAESRVLEAQARRERLDRAEEQQRREAAAAIEAIDKRESDEIRQVGDDLVRERALIVQQQREVNAAEQQERLDAIKAHAAKVRAQALDRERVVNAPGISDSIAFGLARHHIRAASDFETVRVEAKKSMRKAAPGVVVLPDGREVEVGGLGPEQAAALINWRKAAVQRAERAANGSALPDDVESGIRDRFATQRKALAEREPRARAEAERRGTQVIDRAEADRAKVGADLQHAQQEAADERIRLDRAIANAKKDAAEARFRLEQAETRPGI